MRQILLVGAVLLCLLGLSYAQGEAEETFEIKGRVLLNFRGNTTHPEGSPAVGNPQQQKDAFRQMRVVLKGDVEIIRTAMVRQDGSFQFQYVEPGPYLLEVVSPEFMFVPARVDVSKRNKGQVKAKLVEPVNQMLPYPLVLRPDIRNSYFQEVSNPLATIYGLLTSPMILITGAMLILMLVLQMMGGSEIMQEMQQEMSGGSQTNEKTPIDSMPGLVPRPRLAAASK